MKRYNTPHRHRVIKTRLTGEEYAEFSERVTLCKMSQAEFIRQALIKSSIWTGNQCNKYRFFVSFTCFLPGFMRYISVCSLRLSD